jgi:hypothetical protein
MWWIRDLLSNGRAVRRRQWSSIVIWVRAVFGAAYRHIKAIRRNVRARVRGTDDQLPRLHQFIILPSAPSIQNEGASAGG